MNKVADFIYNQGLCQFRTVERLVEDSAAEGKGVYAGAQQYRDMMWYTVAHRPKWNQG